MNRAVLLLAPLLGLSIPALCSAASTLPGINLRWDQCFDDSGAASKSFACDTNMGAERLVLSFELSAPMPSVSGVEINLDFVSSAATMPAWWEFRNVGACRQASLSVSFLPPAESSGCIDWAAGAASGGIGAYVDSALDPSMVAKRVKLAEAVPPTGLVSLDADQEYFACALTISHAKTVGTDSCGGCAVPMCIVLQTMNITTPILADNLYLHQGANTTASQIVHWQDGVPQNISSVCGTNSGCRLLFACVPLSTPTRSSTWGAVKALYR